MKKEVQGSTLNLVERKIMALNFNAKIHNVKSHLNFVYNWFVSNTKYGI